MSFFFTLGELQAQHTTKTKMNSSLQHCYKKLVNLNSTMKY